MKRIMALALCLGVLSGLGCRTTRREGLRAEFAPASSFAVNDGQRVFTLGLATTINLEGTAVESEEGPSLSLAELAATGNWRALEGKARKGLMQNPGDFETLIYLATAMAMQQRIELAGYYAKRALATAKDNPSSALMLNLKALALLDSPLPLEGNRQRARAMFKQCFTSGSPLALACGLNLANLELDQGLAASAQKTFIKLDKLCAGCPVAKEGQVRSLVQLERLNEAAVILKPLLEAAPGRVDLLVLMAGIEKDGLNAKGDAEDHLEDALALLPRDDNRLRPIAEAMLRELNN
jgi:tetratricopeptide (TPR) repeat protein